MSRVEGLSLRWWQRIALAPFLAAAFLLLGVVAFGAWLVGVPEGED